MRIFLICLLAVGAIAADSTKKSTQKKHEKRGILNGNHGGQFYSAHQIGDYVQSGYQHGLQSVPVTSYTADQSYTYSSLPVEQHQTYTSGVHDNVLGQSSVHQVGQNYGLPAGYQGQQLEQNNYGYSSGVSSQPIGQTQVISHQVQVPYSAPHPVHINHPVSHSAPVEVQRSVQIPVPSPVPVYVTKSYPSEHPVSIPVDHSYPAPHPVPVSVNIPHPISVPTSHQEPLNIGHQEEYHLGNGASYDQGSFQENGATFYQNTANLGGLEHHGSDDHHVGYGHVNAGNQQYNFGEQQSYPEAAPLENTFSGSFKTATYEQHDVEPSQGITDGSDSHHTGYHYDKPAKQFTF